MIHRIAGGSSGTTEIPEILKITGISTMNINGRYY